MDSQLHLISFLVAACYASPCFMDVCRPYSFSLGVFGPIGRLCFINPAVRAERKVRGEEGRGKEGRGGQEGTRLRKG